MYGEFLFLIVSVFLVGLRLVFSVQLVLIRVRLIWFSMCGSIVEFSLWNFRFFGLVVMLCWVDSVLVGFFSLIMLVLCSRISVWLLLFGLFGIIMLVLLCSLVSDLILCEYVLNGLMCMLIIFIRLVLWLWLQVFRYGLVWKQLVFICFCISWLLGCMQLLNMCMFRFMFFCLRIGLIILRILVCGMVVVVIISFCEGLLDLLQVVRVSVVVSRDSNRVFFMGDGVFGGVLGFFVVVQGQFKQCFGLFVQYDWFDDFGI